MIVPSGTGATINDWGSIVYWDQTDKQLILLARTDLPSWFSNQAQQLAELIRRRLQSAFRLLRRDHGRSVLRPPVPPRPKPDSQAYQIVQFAKREEQRWQFLRSLRRGELD